MKSRISFFNGTVFKKNITRFAPVWALYSVFLLMLMILLAIDNDSFWFASNVASSIAPFAICNFFYAATCAELLLGDLYNSRMCNALHAMPLRREEWFATNVLSGIAFSLIPNTAFAVICLPLAGELLVVPFLWLAAVTLQYLFFFGTAVLASYCVGNRFAMGLVYIIINGFSLIAYWLVETLYTPLMYGVITRENFFYTLSPLVYMVMNGPYVEVEKQGAYAFARWYFGEGWGYLGICAAIGIVLMGLGLVIYRKRNLECAGDFVTIRALSPVFLLLYTLCGGTCCNAFFTMFIGDESYFFLLLGFVIGFFTGRMLLDRTVRVFRKRTFLAFGAFIMAFSLSFLMVRLDLLGITRWVPNINRIQSASITTGGSNYYTGRNDFLTLTDKEQIEDVLTIHRYGIENRLEGSDGEPDVEVTIAYHMKDGSQRIREYYINHETDVGKLLKRYMSSPEAVLGEVYTEKQPVDIIEVPEADLKITDTKQIDSLLDAMIADAREGNLAQDWNYTNHVEYQFWIEMMYNLPSGLSVYRSVRVSSDARHVVDWLEQHEIYAENWEKFQTSAIEK